MSLIVSAPHDDWNSFPKASIPVLPVFKGFSCFKNNCEQGDDGSVFKHKDCIFTSSGRHALALALEHLGIDNAECSILMPSFHCLSMIAPVLRSTAGIRFYKIKQDLQIDLEDIKKKITPEIKAIIVVHYFGFPQNLDQLVGLCRKHGIFVIEDCAHAFFGRNGSTRIGNSGDIAIGSIKKFFPVQDGGALVCHTPGRTIQKQKKIKWINEIRQLMYMFDEWKFFTQLMQLRKFISRAVPLKRNNSSKNCCPIEQNHLKGIEKIKSWFDPVRHRAPISKISKFIFNHVDHLAICNKRIRHFLYLLDGLKNLDTVAPLHSSLGEGVVPYMFPLILKNPEKDFKRLKFSKVPMWRWEELCITDCRFSRFYSKHLIQLPCHQSLNKKDLDEMVQKIKRL